MKISVVSGGFDPIHSGHISYLKEASEISNKLVVCLNSDVWLAKKKGKPFLPFAERKCILESIKYVDEVISFKDDELGSCINGIEKVSKKYPKDEIIFCNGGDRTNSNIPELKLKNIKFLFSVGSSVKENSSSVILKNWLNYREEREWGFFYNLSESNGVKLKELVINPGKKMSFQRHFLRSETWFISEGECKVKYADNPDDNHNELALNLHDSFEVPRKKWHQIINDSNSICKIIEIQYGQATSEDDIERIPESHEKSL